MPITRHVKVQVAHAPRKPGTFSSSPGVSDPAMHGGTCVTHVPWCMPVSLTRGYLWSRWRGKRSRHSRRPWLMSRSNGNSGNTLARRVFYSLRPSDVAWRNKSEPILAQVMACCLTPPSHHVNLSWPTNNWIFSQNQFEKYTCTAIKGQRVMLHQWYLSTLHDVYDSDDKPFGFSLHFVNGRIRNK